MNVTDIRRQIEQQQQQIQQFDPRIQQTQKQLLGASPMSQIRIKQQELQRQAQKQQALKELSAYELSFEQQIQQQQQKVNTFDYLKRIASKYGKAPESFLKRQLGLSREESALVKDIYEGNVSQAEWVKQQKELLNPPIPTNLLTTQPPTETNKSFYGPIPRAPSGYLYDENKYYQTGKLELVKQTEFQGPVQRFQDEQYFRETGLARPLPLVVSEAKGTFNQNIKKIGSDILRASKENNIPQVARSIFIDTPTALISQAQLKGRESLINFGIPSDAPIMKSFPSPVSSAEIVGGIIGGSLLLDPIAKSGTSAVSVSRYIKNGVVYEIDSFGNVISSKPVSEYKAETGKAMIELRQGLEESAIFQKAGSRYYNEPNLREITRDLIKRANEKQINQLKDFYTKAGREDLFKDILAQEKDLVFSKPPITRDTIIDQPSDLLGSGSLSGGSRQRSEFYGTGLYEKSEVYGPSVMDKQRVDLSQPKDLFFPKVSDFQRTLDLEQNKQNNRLKQNLWLNENELLKQPSKFDEGYKEDSITRPAEVNLLFTPQIERQQQQQKQGRGLILKSPYPERYKETPTRPTRKTPVIIPYLDDDSKRRKLNIFSPGGKDIFRTQIKRRGKFKDILAAGDFSKAFFMGERALKQTLGASFRILKNNKPIPISPRTQEFRYSKRDPFVIVQKQKSRLSSFGERKEIQLFRKPKKFRGNNGFY